MTLSNHNCVVKFCLSLTHYQYEKKKMKKEINKHVDTLKSILKKVILLFDFLFFNLNQNLLKIFHISTPDYHHQMIESINQSLITQID